MLATGKHSPSIATLQKYAQTVGRKLDIRFVQEQWGLFFWLVIARLTATPAMLSCAGLISLRLVNHDVDGTSADLYRNFAIALAIICILHRL